MAKSTRKNSDISANLGFEAKLWAAADALRNNMDAAEYKHVVLGLIFLKYISDAFEAKHAELEAQRAEGADPEDPDEYRAAGIFWVPKEARWQHLKASAPQPTIGTLVDDAMAAIERDNPQLSGVLPKDYARPGLDKQRLGQIINLVSDIALGSAADRARDTLGRVYEYFLIRGIDAALAHRDTFHNDRHPDLKADYVLANPPCNESDRRGELLEDDKRWAYGAPPAGNANFARVHRQ
jgi:type I restriction enzyme M protein